MPRARRASTAPRGRARRASARAESADAAANAAVLRGAVTNSHVRGRAGYTRHATPKRTMLSRRPLRRPTAARERTYGPPPRCDSCFHAALATEAAVDLSRSRPSRGPLHAGEGGMTLERATRSAAPARGHTRARTFARERRGELPRRQAPRAARADLSAAAEPTAPRLHPRAGRTSGSRRRLLRRGADDAAPGNGTRASCALAAQLVKAGERRRRRAAHVCVCV